MEKIEIAIIGAGPSGLSCAIELSKLGYKNIVIFEREDESGGTPRHCGHKGFGILEFQKLLSGPQYARKLTKMAKARYIDIRLKYTLIKIEDDKLIFSTPEGVKKVEAKRVVLAMGARETPRPSRLISGIRSPNIITTGALQRFIYMHDMKPFKKAVIIGSEVVSFSALMSARHAGIEIVALVDEDKELNSFKILKPLTELFLKTPVKIGYNIVSIDGKDKKIQSITIEKDGQKEILECDGVIFSGKFTPESAIAQKAFSEFNHNNNSLYVSQIFQTSKRGFFAVGNLLRGALTAFNCYFEAKKAARYIDKSIKLENIKPLHVKIEADENIQWYYPSLVDIYQPKEYLTKLRLNRQAKGDIAVYLNDKEVFRKSIRAYTFLTVTIPWINKKIDKDDIIKIRFIEKDI